MGVQRFIRIFPNTGKLSCRSVAKRHHILITKTFSLVSWQYNVTTNCNRALVVWEEWWDFRDEKDAEVGLAETEKEV
jgi:hypothetical protein